MGSRFNRDSWDPAVNVTAWLFMVIIVCSLTTRLGTKFYLLKRLAVDDLLITASLIFAISQGVAISLAVGSGYGYHYTTVSTARVDKVMKNLYAASLLYILSVACSKLSMVLFIRDLTPSTKDKRLAIIVEIIVGAWAVVAFLGTAFQCSVPRTWDLWNGQCFSRLAWQYFVASSNIATDLLLMVQVAVLVTSIQTTARRRIMFAAIFLPRLSVPLAIIFQLTTINKATMSNDPTFDQCETTIVEGIVQCLSIVTACWGQLRPFLRWMRSSGFKLNGIDSTPASTFKMTSRSQTGSGTRDSRTRIGRSGAATDSKRASALTRHSHILITAEWDTNSHSSQTNIMAEMEEGMSEESSHHAQAWRGEGAL